MSECANECWHASDSAGFFFLPNPTPGFTEWFVPDNQFVNQDGTVIECGTRKEEM